MNYLLLQDINNQFIFKNCSISIIIPLNLFSNNAPRSSRFQMLMQICCVNRLQRRRSSNSPLQNDEKEAEKSNLVLEVYWFKRHKFSLTTMDEARSIGTKRKLPEVVPLLHPLLKCGLWLFMKLEMNRNFVYAQTNINGNQLEWNMTNAFSCSIKRQSGLSARERVTNWI